MIEIINKSQCNGCHACASVCPKQCISMQTDNEGFLYPQVDSSKCTRCGLCEKICPVLHKKPIDETMLPKAYAAYNIDEEIRMQSSSGGLFTLFATAIIHRGGVVFGASFHDDFSVEHSFTESVEGLAKFRGSKYVQSKIGDSYKQAETFLQQGRWVLFTGTPCQIGGLYAYLRRDYDTLLTQDIICHGVPSPLVWQKYLDEKRKENKTISAVSFRDKEKGWKQFSMAITFANGIRYSKTLGVDSMMRVFLSDWCLRPSCHDCAYKTKNRHSDITLADYWGIEKVHLEMFDDKGTSLLLVHTPKGEAFLRN
ncbi:MAG: Coenzyme F420 hydrogenase/dehydrogenase, beta subunit C-terminal domain [Clostridia bacterium]|nr:Coenzyme F420 hydrogenase/dehydrogenase, beta subunit C-terminal domain [Clostridia bacterium]